MSISTKFNVLRGAMLAAAILLPAAARAASPAETFVETNVNKGLQILNTSAPKEQRLTQFRAFLLNLSDLRRTALFTLGPAKNTASPADVAAFQDAFRDYAFAVYETEFSKYSGQTLRVTGSVAHAPNDALVTTKLIDPHAAPGQAPLEVDFRVLGPEGHMFVGDIVVENLDLAITEQDQFQSFLAQHNNDVKALTADLKQRAANVRATGSVSGGSAQ
jgi:phospholipid transport system substrate-binding protein